MTHFAGLRLLNFMPYRGEHVLELGPKVYAIEAEYEDDPSRSNWGGKSTLAWAIRFLLTGKHPQPTEDAFITGDELLGVPFEKEGGVEGELSDGVFVSRLRKRGSKTALYVEAPSIGGEPQELRDAAAERFLIERYGFTERDSEVTWWMNQGDADLLLKLDPAELTREIVHWFDLESLERAATGEATRLMALLAEEKRVQAIVTTLVRERAGLCWWRADDELQQQLDHCLQWQGMAAGARARARARARAFGDECSSRLRDLQDGKRLLELDAELGRLKGAAPGPTDQAHAVHTKRLDLARTAHTLAANDVATKRRLASGEFDGRCPVGDIVCPVKDQLNASRTANELLRKAAEGAYATAKREYDSARVAVEDSIALRSAAIRRADQIARLEAERPGLLEGAARAIVPDAESDAPPVSDQELDAVERAAAKAIAKLEHDSERVKAIDVELELLKGRIADQGQAILYARASAMVLGRNGAQRRIGEQRLAVIERAGNLALANAGVDMSMRLEWSRPTKAPARQCYACGTAFPKTTTVRECVLCGEPRGKQLDEKLRLVPTRRSGAADYLACIGLRLATFAWLKRKRSSDWGVACLDELFGALDAYNTGALAGHLMAMLQPEYGVEQAFVIAHHAGILAGLPGKIRITAGRGGSSVRVL